MRCIVVNGARPKGDGVCAQCSRRIDENYIREIGSGLIYCNYQGYCVAAEIAVVALGHRAPALAAGSAKS